MSMTNTARKGHTVHKDHRFRNAHKVRKVHTADRVHTEQTVATVHKVHTVGMVHTVHGVRKVRMVNNQLRTPVNSTNHSKVRMDPMEIERDFHCGYVLRNFPKYILTQGPHGPHGKEHGEQQIFLGILKNLMLCSLIPN